VLKTAKTVYEAGRFTYVLPVSALKKINITELEKITVEFLPESEIFYDSDIITTNDNKLLIAEFVREQIYKLLNEEVPYEILVICKKLEERENLLSAAVEIVVNRDSQKGIVIGKNGKILKEIGVNARKKIEYFYGCKVYLDLWVKIINNWQINDEYLKIQGLI
jgi:GTP-binding protein Era